MIVTTKLKELIKSPNNSNLLIINIACILALVAIVTPILWIAQYNYPSADDWSLAAGTYKALHNGGGFPDVLKAAFATVKYNHYNWEGRYSSVFLAALQPGIWGERYYGIVTWLMLGAIIFSEIFLCNSILGILQQNKNRWLCIPIIVPALILQILYTPFPDESFYWYTGSVNYTFVFGLSLILIALFILLGIKDYPKWKFALMYCFTCILAIIVGGNNFATSLSSFLTLLVLSCLFLLTKRKAFYRTGFITLLLGAGLMISIFAPANTVRINSNFNGMSKNPIWAIAMSLVRSFTNIYSWTNLKVILMILFILPFVWKLVKDMKFQFPFPWLFTLLTFGLYASQIAATMYVDGTTGGGRMGAILFYSYFVWIIGNVCYWTGWAIRRSSKICQIVESANRRFGKYLLFYCAFLGLAISIIAYCFDLRELTSYKAYRNWRQGWAQQYAAEWEERLEILHDDSIKEVYFAPLSVHPEMLLYTDLQDEDGFIWVNDACAEYYGKEFIRIMDSMPALSQ